MTKKEVPELYIVMFKKWIADKFEVGDNLTIAAKQNANRKDLALVTIMRHNCGRPKKEVKE